MDRCPFPYSRKYLTNLFSPLHDWSQQFAVPKCCLLNCVCVQICKNVPSIKIPSRRLFLRFVSMLFFFFLRLFVLWSSIHVWVGAELKFIRSYARQWQQVQINCIIFISFAWTCIVRLAVMANTRTHFSEPKKNNMRSEIEKVLMISDFIDNFILFANSICMRYRYLFPFCRPDCFWMGNEREAERRDGMMR